MAKHGYVAPMKQRGAKGSPLVYANEDAHSISLEKGEKPVGRSGSHTMTTNKGEEQRGRVRSRARES